MVKIVLGNIYSKIAGSLPDEVHRDLDKILSYKVHGARHMPRVKKGLWDGVIHLYHRHKGNLFYTGLMSFVRDILKKHNIQYQIVDKRIIPDKNLPDLKFLPPSKFEEREYQEFTIDRSLKYTRGVLSVCTGGGKTMIVAQTIARLQTYPFIFFVLTKDLMKQAHDVLSECLNVPIGMIGDGKADFKKISVCTIQTAIAALNCDNKKFKISDYKFDEEDKWDEKSIESVEKAEKIKKIIRMAKGVYLDECHHASCKTAQEILTSCVNAYWRYGGSATPYRETGDEIMIQAMFGSKIVDINASYLIKNNYLVPPYIFFEPIDSDKGLHSWQKIYSECIVKNDRFNTHVANTANHLVSRDLSCLVLVQHIPQGDFLHKLIPGSEFITGKMSTKKRDEALDNLRCRKTMCLIATTLADEGIDIPSLDSELLAGGGASATRVNQRIGRTIRKQKLSSKDKSIVVVYEHNAKYLKKHAKKVRTILKREPEFIIKNSKGEDFICDEIDEVLGFQNSSGSLFDL